MPCAPSVASPALDYGWGLSLFPSRPERVFRAPIHADRYPTQNSLCPDLRSAIFRTSRPLAQRHYGPVEAGRSSVIARKSLPRPSSCCCSRYLWVRGPTFMVKAQSRAETWQTTHPAKPIRQSSPWPTIPPNVARHRWVSIGPGPSKALSAGGRLRGHETRAKVLRPRPRPRARLTILTIGPNESCRRRGISPSNRTRLGNPISPCFFWGKSSRGFPFGTRCHPCRISRGAGGAKQLADPGHRIFMCTPTDDSGAPSGSNINHIAR